MAGIDHKGIVADFDLGKSGDVMVMRISGLLAHSDCGVFRVMLDKATRETSPAALIVDLGELEFICSTGMSLLVQYQRALADEGRRMVTTGLSGAVQETIEICGVDKLLDRSGTVDVAIGQLEKSLPVDLTRRA